MTCACGCSTGSIKQTQIAANFQGAARRQPHKGVEHLVVPVVLIRQGVLNGAYVSASSFEPYAWNGTPVTVNHPVDAAGRTITANLPQVLEQWQIGTIFNCQVKGDKLVGEAWINPADADRIYPGLTAMLESGAPMDVSTGYFHETEKTSGKADGKPFTAKHTQLKPDHLALLPEDIGACSWEDGCGVRAHRRNDKMPETEDDKQQGRLAAMLAKLLPAINARGADNDRRQMVADLVSNDKSPFTPDSMFALMEMPDDELKALRDTFLGAPANNQQTGVTAMTTTPKAETPAANSAPKVSDMTVEDFTALVTNTAKAAADAAVTEALTANRRQELTAKLTANEALGLTAEELKDMPMSALEKLAANAAKQEVAANTAKGGPRAVPKAGANFAGRGLATNAGADDAAAPAPGQYAGMVTNFDQATKAAAGNKE